MAYNQSFPSANIPIDLINMFNNPNAPNNSLSLYISTSLSTTFSNSYLSSPLYNFYQKFYNSTGTPETFSLLKPGTINYTINGTADITTLFGGISECFYCTRISDSYNSTIATKSIPRGCTNINYIIIGGGGGWSKFR